MGSSGWNVRKNALCTALGLCLSLAATPAAFAASNNDGSVVGHTVPGAVVTIVSPDTGLTRKVTAGANGNYRFPYLPVGQYTLSISSAGSPVGKPTLVTVNLGKATTVNLGAKYAQGSNNATNLGAVQVSAVSIGSIVDVTSTESATNLTRQQLERIPVQHDVAAVALQAPGVVQSNAGIGGISFGGSSGAENAYYVNGLNVTGFYNRLGFSEAPYEFYQQFQVKTGGYSVEFGRTTGGVVNAVVRSGSNHFHFGTDFYMEPSSWQSAADDHYDDTGRRYITASRDRHSLMRTDVWASGPIIKDKLFFFGLYEARGNTPRNTDDPGTNITLNSDQTGFWGGTIDWNVTDNNTLSLMAFSDKSNNVGDAYEYDYDTDTIGKQSNKIFTTSGGRNWALTWSSYLTDNFSMKLMYGKNKSESYTRSQRDLDCNYVSADVDVLSEYNPGVSLGCTTSSTVYEREGQRKQYRADFQWTLGDHLLKFGYDHENDTSIYSRHYSGPGEYYYNVYSTTPGTTIPNGGVVPPGYDAYVRQRQYEIAGTFPTINSAVYIQDNWQVTQNLLLSLGLRNDSFDNQDAEGRSYIKVTRQIAPRLGFSWDMNGDGTTKLFGSLGRYYLPVANVINIKQAGGLLDRRTYYGFDGWQINTLDGVQYAVPRLGPQIGDVDESQGNGEVGDLRSQVNKNMDSAHQDEAILGFQQMITDKWSWGVDATYRRLHNAIDDMDITATPQCGGANGGVGWVMGNPGKKNTVWGDTNCDGTADGWITIDTSRQGWAKYDAEGNYLGQTGWHEPKRTYTAVEFQVNRAWDEKWSFNGSYVLSWNRGNAEGPINSDTDFADTGRTENWDTPWVNTSNGYLPNDRRHHIKLRGTYAISPHWQIGGTFNAHSGGPITAYGVGDPYDAKNYHSYYICAQNCDSPVSEDRIYKPSPGGRGGYDRLPWIYSFNASLTYLYKFANGGELRAKLAVYNLFNQQRTEFVDQDLQTGIGDTHDQYGNDTGIGKTSSTFLQPTGFQGPRYAALSVSVTF